MNSHGASMHSASGNTFTSTAISIWSSRLGSFSCPPIIKAITRAFCTSEESKISPAHTTISIPDSSPEEWNDTVVLVDDKHPALMLTSRLCQTLGAFMQAAKRIERIESIGELDRIAVTGELDRIDATICVLEKKRRQMSRVIADFEDGRGEGECPWNRGHLDGIDDEIGREEKLMDDWQDEGRRVEDEIQREIRSAWSDCMQLAKVLDHPLQSADIIKSEHASWLSERRTLGTLLRKVYQRRNTDGHPFLWDYHEREWTKEGHSNTAPRSDDRWSLNDAYNRFDICRWNRTVAQQDFDDIDDLLRYRDQQYRNELKEAYRDVPRIAAMDHFNLKERARITRNLMQAEDAYRDSVRELRQLGQSVDTYDSTHVSIATSGTHEMSREALRRLITQISPGIRNWALMMPYIPPSPSIPVPKRLHTTSSSSSSSSSSRTSIQIMDSYSAIAGLRGIRIQHAKRKRANKYIMTHRDLEYFTKRRRLVVEDSKTDPSGNEDTLAGGNNVRTIPSEPLGGLSSTPPPIRKLLSGSRRSQWPSKATPYSLKGSFRDPKPSVGTDASIAERWSE